LRSVSLALVAAGVLIFCLASIALSITGIIGRIPGLSSGPVSAPAAVRAAPGSDRRTMVDGAIADESQRHDSVVQHDPLINR
jgi:hypothetical protein